MTSHSVVSCLVASYLVVSFLVASFLVASHLVVSYLAASYLVSQSHLFYLFVGLPSSLTLRTTGQPDLCHQSERHLSCHPEGHCPEGSTSPSPSPSPSSTSSSSSSSSSPSSSPSLSPSSSSTGQTAQTFLTPSALVHPTAGTALPSTVFLWSAHTNHPHRLLLLSTPPLEPLSPPPTSSCQLVRTALKTIYLQPGTPRSASNPPIFRQKYGILSSLPKNSPQIARKPTATQYFLLSQPELSGISA